MARVLYNNYFSVFGFPQHLMSDQGTEFCGKVIAAMCSLLGVEKIRTTPYHPQTNGSAERATIVELSQHLILVAGSLEAAYYSTSSILKQSEIAGSQVQTATMWF